MPGSSPSKICRSYFPKKECKLTRKFGNKSSSETKEWTLLNTESPSIKCWNSCNPRNRFLVRLNRGSRCKLIRPKRLPREPIHPSKWQRSSNSRTPTLRTVFLQISTEIAMLKLFKHIGILCSQCRNKPRTLRHQISIQLHRSKPILTQFSRSKIIIQLSPNLPRFAMALKNLKWWPGIFRNSNWEKLSNSRLNLMKILWPQDPWISFQILTGKMTTFLILNSSLNTPAKTTSRTIPTWCTPNNLRVDLK